MASATKAPPDPVLVRHAVGGKWNALTDSDEARTRFEETGERSTAGLTPQLIGMEGARVEVVDKHGETRRFWVGRSTGWIPCHLEIARTNSSGGPAVMGAPFSEIRVIRRAGR